VAIDPDEPISDRHFGGQKERFFVSSKKFWPFPGSEEAQEDARLTT
jgi:hypothetical protein